MRLSGFFLAIFLVVGCYMPFMPVWLESRGLSSDQIAIALAAPMLLRPLTGPLIALWADVTGSYRTVAATFAAVALAALALLAEAEGALSIGAALTVYALAYKAQLPLIDTVAMQAAAKGAHYGRMRIWGSLSFVAATLCAGVALDKAGAGSALVILGIATAAVLAAAFALPATNPAEEGAPALRGVWSLRGHSKEFRRIAARTGFWWFLLAASAINASHATYYTFGTVHWLSLGASGAFTSLLWMIGVFAEVALFAFAGRGLMKISPSLLIGVAGAACILRWGAMAFDPPWAVAILLQVLHGLTFGACHLGAMAFMARSFPPHHAGTAQAIYGSISAGLLMAVATASIGPLYRDFDALAYVPMAVMGAAGLALALKLAARGQPQSSLRGGETQAPS